MQINGVNLVPAERREARRRHRRSRVWVGACAVYVFAWVAIYAAIQATMASDDRALRGEIEHVRGVVAERQTALDAISLDHQQIVAQLHANLAVGKQPDWSILLALLSTTLEDEIVLRTVHLVSSIEEPPDGVAAPRAGTPAGSVAPAPVSLDFGGLGQSQAAVSRFVLRLEEITLFRSVKLLDTRREPFLAGHAIAFRVECVLDAAGGPNS